jgi:hypothetical protein
LQTRDRRDLRQSRDPRGKIASQGLVPRVGARRSVHLETRVASAVMRLDTNCSEARPLQNGSLMRQHDRQQRSTQEMRTQGAGDGKERKAVAERSEAHRRWIGEDGDDGACRGID